MNPEAEQALNKWDWSSLRSFGGRSESLTDAIRALICAESSDAANRAYWQIDNVTMIQGRLSQSSQAVASCLVASLPSASAWSLPLALDLLAQISGGYENHVDADQVGPASRAGCMSEIVAGFDFYCRSLRDEGNSSAIDLILMCALFDISLRDAAIEEFKSSLDLFGESPVRGLIEASLEELEP